MEITQDITYFIFILARISGCIIFNQVFGRGNVPVVFQIGLILMLSITVYGILPVDNFMEVNLLLEYVFLILKELFVGFIIGHIIKLFMSVIVIAGDVLDLQMGLSMAKIYDPKINISMGISGSLLNVFFMLLFFSVGGHLTLIKIFISSCKIIPIGNVHISKEVILYAVELFSYILIYAVKLTLPIMAMEFIVEVGMGIMMKAIPQIHLFVVNIPVKIFIGFMSLLILVPTFSSFLEKLITLMFEAIQKSLSLLM
ncbi:flagellar biosynthetic protein FliR [Sedimentibacter sp. zth1]|uniref:flagellar biosynthetic protein FliR n=1 Tax=Sedimentibacter sp. zth1 TaxID=2816908 RepID=UPI001A932E74|nr:flagellar biosynthetic protein FliR [Sedimentibacter sp. zth1]QSX07185.1 flagellar biosynthetic protein FliR [Sedimentibacter sp. zth1]